MPPLPPLILVTTREAAKRRSERHFESAISRHSFVFRAEARKRAGRLDIDSQQCAGWYFPLLKTEPAAVLGVSMPPRLRLCQAPGSIRIGRA
jgi:hypothetical protein